MENVTNKSDIVKFDISEITTKVLSMIDQYCLDNDIKDIYKLTQLQFNAVLQYIGINYFSKLDLLKSEDNKLLYDADKVNRVIDLYMLLCNKYNKVCTIHGFSFFSGISDTTIDNWGAGKGAEGASRNYFALYKRIYNYNERTLSDKLISKDVNPVGVIAILNHSHNWQQQEVVKQRQAETIPLDKIASSIGINLLDDKSDN